MVDHPSLTEPQLIAQQFQQEMGRLDSTDSSQELGAEVVGGSAKSLNGWMHAPLEDSVEAELLNGIALRTITPSAQSPTSPSGNSGKQKRQESVAPQGSPEKRRKETDLTLAPRDGNTTAAKSPAPTSGKLKRVSKLSRHARGLDHINHRPRGDVYAIPDQPVEETSEGSEALSGNIHSHQSANNSKLHSAKNQQKRPVMRSQPTIEQAKSSKRSNPRPQRTQISNTSKTRSKAVGEDNEESVSPLKAKSKKDSLSDVHDKYQMIDSSPPKSPSNTRVPRSQETSENSEFVGLPKEHGREMTIRLQSSKDGNADDVSLEENVDNVNDHGINPEGQECSDHDQDCNVPQGGDDDDNESNNQDSSDEVESNQEADDTLSLSGQNSAEDLVGTIKIELFGEADSWATVLEGAREVAMSKSGGERAKRVPILKTRTVRDLVKLTVGVRSIYLRLLSHQGVEYDDLDEHHEQRVEVLDQLREEINNLGKSMNNTDTDPGEKKAKREAKKEALKTTRDIYTHAIPHMVLLLQTALQCRTTEYSNEHDTDVIKEIIDLQENTLTLCKIARKSKVNKLINKSNSSPTTQKIYPYLQDTRRVFQAVLSERQHQRNLMEQDDYMKKIRERRDDENRRRKEENARKKEESRRQIAEDLGQIPASNDYSGSIWSTQPSNDIPILDTSQSQQPNWTDEQIRELLNRLQWKQHRDLPGLDPKPHLRSSH